MWDDNIHVKCIYNWHAGVIFEAKIVQCYLTGHNCKSFNRVLHYHRTMKIKIDFVGFCNCLCVWCIIISNKGIMFSVAFVCLFGLSVCLSFCLFVCLSVCLSVSNIIQNVMNGLQ